MTDRLAELRKAMQQAQEDLNRAQRAWADARDAYDAEKIANALYVATHKKDLEAVVAASAGLEFFVSWKATRVAHFAPLTLFPPF